MALGTRQTNTMAEGLRKINGEISDLKFEPDADVTFLVHLETEILSYLKNPPSAQDPNAQPSQIPQGPQGPPAGPPQQFGPLQPQGGPPGGAPGLPAAPGPVNPDELRRVLQQTGGPA